MKIIIHDEISMTEKHIFSEYINLKLQLIKGYLLAYRGVSIITSGDLSQFPPVFVKALFQPPKTFGYNPLGENLWIQLFKINESPEIVRHSSDSKFVQILIR